MTKFTSLLLALMLSAFCVVGCTNETESISDNAAIPNESSQSAPDPTDQLRRKIADLEKELSAVQSDFSKLSEDNDTLQAENETLKNNNEALSSNNKKLTDDYNTLESSYDVLSAEHNALKENSVSTEEYQTLQTELEKTITDFNILQSYCGTLESRIISQTTIDSYEQQISSLNQQINTLNQQIQSLSSKNAQLSAEKDTLSQKVSELQKAQTITEQYTTLQTSYNELKTSYDSLTVEYNALYQLYISNYNPSGSQSSSFDKMYVTLLEKLLIVKSCIETYYYYDYNISTAFYTYLIDTNDGLKYIKDTKNDIYNDRWFGEMSKLGSWISINSFDYPFMDGNRLRNIKTNYDWALDKLENAWDSLYKAFSNDSMTDHYNKKFQRELESARDYIAKVSSDCEYLTSSCINALNSYAQ